MSDALTDSDPARRVPAWHARWRILLRLYPEIGAEYPSLFGLWLRRRDAFWQYILRTEERRLVREAVERGDACPSRRTAAAPPVGAWRE